MALPTSGEISARAINDELRRSTSAEFSIESARLGGYGAINDASGLRPTGGGQNGREYDDWWGYNHSAQYPFLYAFVRENVTDTNLRFYVTNAYGANVLAEAWLYGNTGPWTDVGATFGVRIRESDRIQVLWNWFGWGSFSRGVYKAVYSNQRGTFINYGCDQAGIQRVNEFVINSGELVYCYAVDDYSYC
jgi:hypothetical protein